MVRVSSSVFGSRARHASNARRAVPSSPWSRLALPRRYRHSAMSQRSPRRRKVARLRSTAARPADPPALQRRGGSQLGDALADRPRGLAREPRQTRETTPPQRQGAFGRTQPGLPLVQRPKEPQIRRFVDVGGRAGHTAPYRPPSTTSATLLLP